MTSNIKCYDNHAKLPSVMAGTSGLFVATIADAIDGAHDLSTTIMKTLTQWMARSVQRRHLAELDDHILRDIGLEYKQAIREADKPFWKA
jgi:uncharacterized protein YjiS (DUF1127 family)